MTGDTSASSPVDPTLTARFALLREPGPGPDGPLDGDDEEVVATRAEIAAGSSHIAERLARYGLVFSEVRRVVLDSDRVMLVIPGSAGLFVLVRNTKRHQTAGSSAGIEGRLDGRPVLASNQTMFGLAPDGVVLQRVGFRDGSTGEASVRHNTYMIDDPSWLGFVR
jgi:hypothetical protein